MVKTVEQGCRERGCRLVKLNQEDINKVNKLYGRNEEKRILETNTWSYIDLVYDYLELKEQKERVVWRVEGSLVSEVGFGDYCLNSEDSGKTWTYRFTPYSRDTKLTKEGVVTGIENPEQMALALKMTGCFMQLPR